MIIKSLQELEHDYDLKSAGDSNECLIVLRQHARFIKIRKLVVSVVPHPYISSDMVNKTTAFSHPRGETRAVADAVITITYIL